MMTAGNMKHAPATIKPFQPALSRPMCIVISVEFGPGMRLVAPTRSRKCSAVSHCLLRTTSSSIIAICTAGPPNPMMPSLPNNKAISFRDVCCFVVVKSTKLAKKEICRNSIWLGTKCFYIRSQHLSHMRVLDRANR